MNFQIGEKSIGYECPTYLIAEVGTTANGDLTTAKALIDLVKESGFDAIKFQNIKPSEYMSDRSLKYTYQTAFGREEKNMFEMLQSLVFSPEAWSEIMSYAKSRDLTCFATVNWLGGVDMMESLSVPAYKIASWDLNYPDLQKKIFQTGKPVFIDLGPIDIVEVLKIRRLAQTVGNNKVVFLYDFHTNSPAEMHMRAIPYLSEKLEEPVGFSSPGKESAIDILSLGLGAKVLEKRVTLNDRDKGHHHFLAVSGQEAFQWVREVRLAETMLGSRALIPSAADLSDAKKYFRALTTRCPIKKGEIFSESNLIAKRPMKGISPEFSEVVLGRPAARDFEADVQIGWDAVDFEK